MKCRHGNNINEKDTVVILTPQPAMTGKIIAVKDVLNAPVGTPPLIQVAVSVVINMIVPRSQAQMDNMWVVKEPADAKSSLEL